MPNLNITPQKVLLTSGQAATFQATDAEGKAASVSWSLSPPVGTLAAPAVGTQAISATYVAPSLVPGAQTIAVIATAANEQAIPPTKSTTNESASATISLTPDAIAIFPARVDLKAGESQKFTAIVAGAPTTAAAPAKAGAPTGEGASTEEGASTNITWILSPPLGSLSATGLTGSYNAPDRIPDTTTVTIMTLNSTFAKQAVAAINLTSPPWKGLGVLILGGFLLMVFSLVFFMMGLWPPALPGPDTAKANRIEAERTLEEKTTVLEKAEIGLAEAEASTVLQGSNKTQPQPAGTPGGAKTDGIVSTPEAAKARADAAREVLQRAQEGRDFAAKDLSKKRDVEESVNDPGVDTKLAGHINRELDLLWLVLLAGSLGSFLHTAQSYTAYVGNQTIKSTWATWYAFRPFIGAGLALVFYASIRGGVMAIATGSSAKASELNPFGLVGVAALVGMFSRDATIKLGEVFETLFKSDKAKESKDKLVQSSQSSSQPAGTAAAGAAASTATK